MLKYGIQKLTVSGVADVDGQSWKGRAPSSPIASVTITKI